MMLIHLLLRHVEIFLCKYRVLNLMYSIPLGIDSSILLFNVVSTTVRAYMRCDVDLIEVKVMLR